MKQLIFLLAITMSIHTAASAQGKGYTESKDTSNGEITWKGMLTFAELAANPEFGYWWSAADTYKPNEAAIKQLRAGISNYDLIIFLGTWCSDSHMMVPQLYTVLAQAGYDTNKPTIIGADREKDSGTAYSKQYQATRLPTVVVLKDGKEVGRITETVSKSVEDDLAAIIR